MPDPVKESSPARAGLLVVVIVLGVAGLLAIGDFGASKPTQILPKVGETLVTTPETTMATTTTTTSTLPAEPETIEEMEIPRRVGLTVDIPLDVVEEPAESAPVANRGATSEEPTQITAPCVPRPPLPDGTFPPC